MDACNFRPGGRDDTKLANFAQYVMWVKGWRQGHGNAAVQGDPARWHVPGGVNRVAWLFHADILNAGSTCVESDLFYVNPWLLHVRRQPAGLAL